jgi:hypothetical protein
MLASRTARSMTSAVRTVARQATATRTYVAPAAVRVTASTVRPVNTVAKRSNATAGTKDVSRSAWAQDPKISYREVKKLSDQPNTVRTAEPDGHLRPAADLVCPIRISCWSTLERRKRMS